MADTPSEVTAVSPAKPAWLQFLKVITPAIVAGMGSWAVSGSTSAEVKDKAEAGYQFARQDIEEIKDSLKALQENDVRLAAEIADVKRRAKLSTAKRAAEAARAAVMPPPPPAVNVTVNAPPAPLPRDLDKALEQQKASKE